MRIQHLWTQRRSWRERIHNDKVDYVNLPAIKASSSLKVQEKLETDFKTLWLTHLTVLQGLVQGPCVIHPEWSIRPKGRYPKGGHIAMIAMAILGLQKQKSKQQTQLSAGSFLFMLFSVEGAVVSTAEKSGGYYRLQTWMGGSLYSKMLFSSLATRCRLL